MYKIALITTIALLGCGCTKTDPSYVTKEQGRKLTDSLTLCIESANKLTDKVNNHEARLATLETRSGVPASGSAGVTYVLNPNDPPPLTFTDTRQPAAPLTSTGPNVITGAPATVYGYIQLPPIDLAFKFGEYTKGTDLHLAAIDDGQKKQDDRLDKLSDDVTALTDKVKTLTEKLEQEDPKPQPTPPPPAEAPSPTPPALPPPAEAPPPSST